MEKPFKTRVFRAGNSQAVRVPKALELPKGEAYIEPRDGRLFVSTLRGRWDLFFAEPGVDVPFDRHDLRDNRPRREVSVAAANTTAPAARKPRLKRTR